MKRMKKTKNRISIMLVALLAANIVAIPVLALPSEGNQNTYIWDFTKMDVGSVGDITLSKTEGKTVTSSAQVELDGTEKVLQWKNSNFDAKNTESYMTLDIPDIELDNEKIIIEFTMKGGISRLGKENGFPGLVGTVTNENEEVTNKITKFGILKWNRADKFRIFSDESVYSINNAITEWKNANGGTMSGSFLDSASAENDYYDYKFVIDTENESFRFYYKKNRVASWTEPYAGITAGVISDGNIKTGDLPDTLTELRFSIKELSDNINEQNEETIHKFKSIKVEKLRLNFEGTNIPDGDNPLFAEKNIMLDFNYAISDDSITDGIKLFENGSQMDSSRYTLEVDSTDNTVVWVNLNEFPQYGHAYEVKINDALNKNKSGFIKLDNGYSKSITFHNEQSADLAVESTTPENGSIHSSKQIKLDFSSAINMDSAKEQIAIWKGDIQLEIGKDYTLNFEENDESVIYVNLTEMPEISTAENRINYKVQIGTQLNSGKFGYTVFPTDYEQKTIIFHNEQKANLAVESTTPENGSIHSSKQIKLDFSSAINMDSAKEQITVWKGDIQLEIGKDYTLSYEINDESSVCINLAEIPVLSTSENVVNYKVIVGAQLNAGKTGYTVFPTDYEQKIIVFRNEQSADLEVESTTPDNDSSYSSKQIKLDFSSAINMDSAKEQITVRKGDTQLEIDTDYTLRFEENDESIIYVNLTEIPEISTVEDRIYYTVKVGTKLNEGKVGYAIFPKNYEQRTISFYNKIKSGKIDCEIDFTQYGEIADVSGVVFPNDTPFVIGKHGEENVLIWSTRNGTGSKEELKSYIEFDEQFDVMEGPVEIEFTAKIPNSYMAFQVMGSNANEEIVEFDQYVGIDTRSWTDFVRRKGTSTGVTKFTVGGSDLDNTKASAKYISYKFVIDAMEGVVKFYAKEDGTLNWTEQFPGDTIELSSEIDNITGVCFKKCIGKPVDKGGSADEMISWYVKDIKVTQVTTPAVTYSTIENDATDISDELGSIEMGFNTTISSEGISKENVTLVKVERDIEVPVDESLYDVDINADKDGIVINFNDDLGMDRKYRLKINNIVANTEEKGVMSAEKVIEFETAKKYELVDPEISHSDAGISIEGDLRTYYKASGEDYVIMAVLVNSNNEFSDIEYIVPGAVPQAINGFNPLEYNLTLAKPDDFNPQEYTVRLYAINALSGSSSNCKMLEVPFISQ